MRADRVYEALYFVMSSKVFVRSHSGIATDKMPEIGACNLMSRILVPPIVSHNYKKKVVPVVVQTQKHDNSDNMDNSGKC